MSTQAHRVPLVVGSAAWLRQRFDRLGLGIRCAYNPHQPAVIRCWLALGTKIVRAGRVPELQMQRRMLDLLLRTAQDDALPWFWRSVCLEHTTMPAARLHTLLNLHDPLAAEAVHEALQQAHEGLAAVPPTWRGGIA